MKNVKRVFNASRGKWVKVICKDEPVAPPPPEQLRAAYARLVKGPAPAPPAPSRDNGQSR